MAAGRTVYRDGDVSVELDDALLELVRRVAEEVAPGVLAQMETERDDIFRQARGNWPIKTGESARGLEAVTIFTDEAVTVKILNPVKYAPYIRPRDLHGGTTAWQFWVRGPMFEARRALARDLGDVIVRAALGR